MYLNIIVFCFYLFEKFVINTYTLNTHTIYEYSLLYFE